MKNEINWITDLIEYYKDLLNIYEKRKERPNTWIKNKNMYMGKIASINHFISQLSERLNNLIEKK